MTTNIFASTANIFDCFKPNTILRKKSVMTRLLDQRPENISICLEPRSPCPHCGPPSHCEEKFLPNTYSRIFTFFDIPSLLLVGLSTFAYLNILKFQRVGNFRCKNPTLGIIYLLLTSSNPKYSLPWIACLIA